MLKLKVLITEAISGLRGKILEVLYIRPSKKYTDPKKTKIPIIAIQGINNRWAALKLLLDLFSDHGYPIYVVKDLGSNFQPIAIAAKLVKEFAEKLNLKEFIVLGHSKGGLVGKYILSNLNQDGSLKGLVAIATPFSGSPIVAKLPFSSYHELGPGSEIISILEKNTAVNQKIVSIFPEYDNLIPSELGSSLIFAQNIKLPVQGHHAILFDKASQQKIFKVVENMSQTFRIDNITAKGCF